MFPTNGKTPGLMIAAPRSGSGKTTVTLGLLRALTRRGLVVQPFKCGPDYIDPAFHSVACGRPSYNLDSWAMRKITALGLMDEAATADIVVAEALMGLFDGVASDGAWGDGSSAGIAKLGCWPVVLVLDISGQSQTAAAAARGFAGYETGVEIAGVILNRVASARHEHLARSGFERIGMRVFGALPKRDDIRLPERHLGLVQAGETSGLEKRLDALADLAETHLDLEGLIGTARSHSALRHARDDSPLLRPPAERIAIAQDTAFSFVYPHILKAWRVAGAELLPFSPLNDEGPSPNADMAWLPGGYPELHAGALAANGNFIAKTTKFAAAKPVHGECGGLMVLGEGLTDARGERHRMLELLPLETSFAVRKLHLGYRKATLLADCILGRQGDTFGGHEFHYASVTSARGSTLFDIADANGNKVTEGGIRRDGVTGSFFHIVDRIVPMA